MLTKESNILIIGLGLIGGSYAAKLSSKGYKVYGIDINENSIKFAKNNGYIINDNLSDNDKVALADLIIFTVYPKQIPVLVEKYQPYFKDEVLLSDVSGTKSTLLKEVRKILNPKYRYVSHHPMAGREKSGVEFAKADLFKDANFIIIRDGDEDISELEELARIIEFRNISILTSEKHDEVIGYLSQLTHAIAISLMNARDTNHMIKYTGDSFRDLTRIACINEVLWSELFFENKDILIQEIDTFADALFDIKKCLINEDSEKLKELMKESTIRREKFNK